MNAILDTHVVLWFVAGDRRLSGKWRRLIESAERELYLSAVSAVEISIKVSRDKLRLSLPPREFIQQVIDQLRLLPLPLTIPHAWQVAELPSLHKDPFDRMLIAQSIVEDIPILSRDAVLREYPASVIW